jgi:hypothetical protein
MMKRVLAAVAALACVALLSSCSVLPIGPNGTYPDTRKQADVEMGRVADAINHHDATSLKKLFSKSARAKAVGLDSGLRALLAAFPSGFTSWKQADGSPGENIDNSYGKETLFFGAGGEVHANGKLYELYFAYYPVNQVEDPNNVGLNAIGVAPYSKDSSTPGAKTPLEAWASQFHIEHGEAAGNPGVFISQK